MIDVKYKEVSMTRWAWLNFQHYMGGFRGVILAFLIVNQEVLEPYFNWYAVPFLGNLYWVVRLFIINLFR
jgi:hypothetical protein